MKNKTIPLKKKKKKVCDLPGLFTRIVSLQVQVQDQVQDLEVHVRSPHRIDMFSIDIIITCMGNLILTFIYY